MIVPDTNVIVRLIINDDPAQTSKARLLVERETLLLLPTVLLETVWVLGSVYGFGRDRIAEALKTLFGIRTLQPWDADAAMRAFDWFEAGCDFGDALHLAASTAASSLVTFDKALAAKAKTLPGTIPVHLL
ncbi:MAG: type II toxin-antitoxin system VapC family toxin [Beijerinckiaceae bacterium]